MPFSLGSWFYRKRVHAEVRLSGRPVLSHRVVNPYHAVSIEPGPKCCKAVSDLEEQLFLAAAAPKIPLPQCDQASCTCRYVHHEDRRSMDRRVKAHNRRPRLKNDRRADNGRRATD